MPGAVTLIDQLRDAGFRLAVGRPAPPENIALTLQLLERDDSFQAVVTGNDVRRGKPDPEVFLLAAARLELPAGHCAVIEDAPHGITAAQRGGMVSVALLGTATRGQLSDADVVVEHLDGTDTPTNAGRPVDEPPLQKPSPRSRTERVGWRSVFHFSQGRMSYVTRIE